MVLKVRKKDRRPELSGVGGQIDWGGLNGEIESVSIASGGKVMGYRLEGKLLEVCTCNTLCPCWIGEDPDGGVCEGTFGWHFDSGEIDGVDVSGLTLGAVAHIPGNVLKGNWTAMIYMDDRATPEQEEAILNVYTGKLGGPVADLMQLVGEVKGVERVPIIFDVEEGKGTLKLGDAVNAELEPFIGATGKPTALYDTIFTTIAGSPAYVSKAPHYDVDVEALGLKFNLTGHNAVQGTFLFEA